LSACQTGKGEVTSEGVFNLWCALLQAGAPAVIVSLWKVDDGSTKALIKGMRTPWSWIEVVLLLVHLLIFSVNLALLQIVKEVVGHEAVDIISTQECTCKTISTMHIYPSYSEFPVLEYILHGLLTL